tara:strand:+ start:2474 stop:2794 length:321 start_codon:yes stop_codon:yes gene_type:complete
MELTDTDINDAVEECDKLRKELEGVGLSDGLVKCIELAYMLGAASVTDEKLVLKVFDCLIATAKNLTDLENIYSSDGLESVSWAEVYEARKFLGEMYISKCNEEKT